MFKTLGGLTKLVVNTAMLPVDAAADLFTLGGELVDKKSFTVSRINKMADNLDDIGE